MLENDPLSIEANERRIEDIRQRMRGVKGRPLGPTKEGMLRSLAAELWELTTQTDRMKQDVSKGSS